MIKLELFFVLNDFFQKNRFDDRRGFRLVRMKLILTNDDLDTISLFIIIFILK